MAKLGVRNNLNNFNQIVPPESESDCQNRDVLRQHPAYGISARRPAFNSPGTESGIGYRSASTAAQYVQPVVRKHASVHNRGDTTWNQACARDLLETISVSTEARLSGEDDANAPTNQNPALYNRTSANYMRTDESSQDVSLPDTCLCKAEMVCLCRCLYVCMFVCV